MKLLKNKFLLTVLGIALAVAVSATVLAVMGVEDPVKNLFGTLTAPLRWCASKIAYGIEGFGVYFSSVEKLSEENAELRRENAELRAQLSDAQAAARQDEYLRGYLGLDWLENNWSLSDATVIGRESGSYRTLYTLNRGSLHGIKRGMPVVTAEGLVGRVEQVGLGYCTVTSVLETTSSVGVYDARSGASGLLVGDLSLREQGKCKVTYVDIDADVQLGDLIVTAGTGSIYPAGLTVGRVTALEPDPYSRTMTVIVTPMVDLDHISTVLVITDYSIVAYDKKPSDTEKSDTDKSGAGAESGTNGGASGSASGSEGGGEVSP